MHGGATGADQLVHNWAVGRGVRCTVVPAQWEQHGKAAGPKRNRAMLDLHHPDVLLAFPGDRGTRDCVRAARERGIPVWGPYLKQERTRG